MVFLSLLGFLLIVASVRANKPEECVQNPSLPQCHPQQTVMEDVPGEYVKMCIEGLLQDETCHYCNLNDTDVRCHRTPDIGRYTFECFIHNNTRACDFCHTIEAPHRCLGFPSKNVSGEYLKACINGLHSSESCDFCRSNRFHPKCLRPYDIGDYTVECILSRNTEACDLCHQEMDQPDCIGFPATPSKNITEERLKEDVSGEYLKACINGLNGSDTCDYCRKNRNDSKCLRPSDIGEYAVECILNSNTEACDFCHREMDQPDCIGLPATPTKKITGELLKACINGVNNNENCVYCRNNSSDLECQRPSDIGGYTVECCVNGKFEACDLCHRRMDHPECVGFPPFYFDDNYGKTMSACIYGPDGNEACDYCRQNSAKLECQIPSGIGKLTVECVFDKNMNMCEYCKQNFFKPDCAGLPAPSTENYGRIVKKCYDEMDIAACNYCLSNINDPDCRRSFVPPSPRIDSEGWNGFSKFTRRGFTSKIRDDRMKIGGEVGRSRGFSTIHENLPESDMGSQIV